MKFLIMALFFVGSTSFAKDLGSINLSEPPFWMPSYDEFHDLQGFQKDFYLSNFLVRVKALGLLKSPSKRELSEAAEWHEAWAQIRLQVYKTCLDEKNLRACEKLADVRLKTFELAENQKFENRRTRGVSEED